MEDNKWLAMTVVRIHPGFSSSLQGDDQYIGSLGFKNYIRFGNQAVQADQNDIVFGGEISQEIVFDFAVKRYMDRFLKGQDVSIVAYGDHYTGKSYTIFGRGFHYTDSEIHFGMLPRGISYVFSKLELTKTGDFSLSQHLKISMFELFGFGMKDLLVANGEVVTFPTIIFNEKGLLTFSVMKRDCFSAMQAMQMIAFGMSQRTIHPHNKQHLGTVIVKLELYRPEMKGAEIQSQILFVDLACHNVIHPVSRENIHFDIHILTLLANSQGNTISSDEMNLFQGCIHFKVFQDFFKDKMESLFICCISPRRGDIQLTTLYTSVLWHVYRNRSTANLTHTGRLQQTDDHNCGSEENRSQLSSILITQAERLFSQLITNTLLADEERGMIRLWMNLKQEIVDETDDAQAQPHLERIEEVTESEEEFESSDGRISIQENLEENSVHESDQEELDQKVCLLSEREFLENVQNTHVTFCSYVDSQVDVLSPSIETRTSFSTPRRGMQELPVIEPQSVWIQDSTAQATANVTQADISQNACGPAASSGDHHLNPQDNLPERNEILTDIIKTQYRFEELVLKCQAVLPTNALKPSSRGEEARASSPFQEMTLFFEVLKNINDHMEILERIVSPGDEELDNTVSLQDHRLRQFRSIRERVIMSKSKIDKKIKSKVYHNEDLRNYLITDEMTEILDRSNEFLNCLRIQKEVPYPHHSHSEMWKMIEGCIHELLSPLEIKNLLAYYFTKVVDLRESTLDLESSISTMEQSLHKSQLKINSLGLTIVKLRNQKAERNEVGCYKSPTSKVPTNTVAMTEEEGACGAASSSTIPQQNLSKLQVSKCEPPPKVMRSQNNKKLVVELNRKKL